MSNYPLYAGQAGETTIDELTHNSRLALHDTELIYTGTVFDSKNGSGVLENDCAGYSCAIRFKLNGVTEISRVELDIATDGTGADLTLEIRSDMDPAAGIDGYLLRAITIPGAWLPASQAYYSLPIPLTGLTSGAYYWLIVRKAGNSINHFHIYGESSQDASYPVYKRSASSGAWTADNAMHFRFYSGVNIGDDLLHQVTGGIIMNFTLTTEPVTGIKFITGIKLSAETVDGVKQVIQDYQLPMIGTNYVRGINI